MGSGAQAEHADLDKAKQQLAVVLRAGVDLGPGLGRWTDEEVQVRRGG